MASGWTSLALAIRNRAALIGVGLLTVAAVLTLLSLGRDFTFFRDEWYFVAYRSGETLDTFLAPHAGHLSLIPAAVYMALFETAGLAEHWAYRLVAIGLHVVCALLVYLLARRRVGDLAALAPFAIVLFFGPGWMDILWAFQIGFLASLASGLAMLLAFESQPRRRDELVCALLAISLASSGVGLAFLAGAFVHWALTPARLRRFWVWAFPAVLFVAWYLAYGRDSSQFVGENVALTPAYVFDAAAAAAGSLGGLGVDLGNVLALLLGFVVVRRFLSPGGLGASCTTFLVVALVFWTLTGLARASENDPGASRYLYPGAIFVLLIVVDLAPTIRWRGKQLALLAAACAVVLLVNIGALVKGARDPEQKSRQVRIALGALELVGKGVDAGFQLEGFTGGAAPIPAGPYLDAVERWDSSPALSGPELAQLSEPERQAADRVMVGALAFSFVPSSDYRVGGAPEPDRVSGTRFRREGGCFALLPNGPGATVDLPYPRSGLALKLSAGPAATVLLRRLSGGFDPNPVLGPLNGGSQGTLRIPRDGLAARWHVRIISAQPLRICGLSGRRPPIGVGAG